MRIFEFAFNPKKRKDHFFEVFTYEPKSIKEKPKGSLYIIGELGNALEFNSRFLKRLSRIIQEEYYNCSLKGTASALKAALTSANHFLTEESKKGNVDWLGNLDLAVLLFVTVGEKKAIFHLAKTGEVKISLTRKGVLVDVGKNLDSSSHVPGKIFSNLVSTSLKPKDSIIVISKEIFDILSREKSLREIGTLKEAKEFREFFSKRQRMLSLSSGVLVSFVVEEEIAKRSPINKSLFPSFPKPRLMLKKSIKLNLSRLNMKSPWMRHPSAFRKKGTIVLSLLVLLLLGFLFFK